MQGDTTQHWNGSGLRSVCAGSALVLVVSAMVFGLAESTGPDGSNAQAVHTLGFRGQGVSIAVISQSHARVTHEAFFDKDQFGNPVEPSHAHWYDATDLDIYEPITHDTYVAGIACSRGGAAQLLQKGAAPEAELYSYRVTRPISENDPNRVIDESWVQDALDQAAADGCDVVVTAVQLGGTADGESLWSLMYDYYAYEHELFFATAAGNGASSVTIFGDSCNSLTTGGLIVNAGVYDQAGTISNPGPTVGANPRRKPEAGAPSPYQMAPNNNSDTSWSNVPGTTQGYTSYAAPHTAGAAAVLLSYAASTPEANDGRSEVIKAALVNATFPNIRDDTGNYTIEPFVPNMPWHAERGYGRLDVLRAFETLSAATLTPGATAAAQGWAYQTLAGGQSHSYFVQGIRRGRLVATATWKRRVVWTDPHGPGHGMIEAGELTGYTADIDLRIYGPQGQAIAGIPTTYNAKDNLEKCDALLSASGTYEIRVVNKSAGETAAYGLAFELIEGMAGDVHVDYTVDVQDAIDLADWWLYTNCANPSQPCNAYNLSPNAAIDMSDLAVIGANWLLIDERYWRP